MRVLVFLKGFVTGGVERTALRLIHAWHALGIEVVLWIGRDAGSMRAEFADGLAVISPEPGASGALASSRHLADTIRRTAPDILFCAGNTYTARAVLLKAMLGRACPPVVVKISNDLRRADMPAPVRAGYRLWLRVQGSRLDHFVAMAPAMRAEIEQLMRVAPERVSVIEDPSIEGLPVLKPRAPRPGEGRRFVTVGRLVGQKNQPLMLRAFAAGARADDRLTLLGDGPLLPALKVEAAQLGLSGRVDFAGYAPDAAARLGEHDIFLLSSDYEGVPAALIEALAAGLPIIATRCSAAIGDLLDQGALGRLVEPGDEAGFARAIAEAVPGDQQVDAARAMAARFTVAVAAQHYARLFERLSAA